MSKFPKSKSSKDDLTKEQKDEIKAVFNVYDPENTNKMDIANLKAAMRALGFEPRKEEIKQLTKSLKIEEGKITYEQFYDIMAERTSEKGAKDEIMKAFRLFDDDETGKISISNLKRVAKELGETISEEELKEMITEADLDGDGEVNSDEFYRIMKKTSLY